MIRLGAMGDPQQGATTRLFQGFDGGFGLAANGAAAEGLRMNGDRSNGL